MANLRYWSLQLPAPPNDIADAFEREWQKITTGKGAAESGIEKFAATANKPALWRCWVGFETDKEMYEFANWFGKQSGVTFQPTKVRQYRKDGEDVVDAVMKPEFFH